jgi:hypothetical protein
MKRIAAFGHKKICSSVLSGALGKKIAPGVFVPPFGSFATKKSAFK